VSILLTTLQPRYPLSLHPPASSIDERYHRGSAYRPPPNQDLTRRGRKTKGKRKDKARTGISVLQNYPADAAYIVHQRPYIQQLESGHLELTRLTSGPLFHQLHRPNLKLLVNIHIRHAHRPPILPNLPPPQLLLPPPVLPPPRPLLPQRQLLSLNHLSRPLLLAHKPDTDSANNALLLPPRRDLLRARRPRPRRDTDGSPRARGLRAAARPPRRPALLDLRHGPGVRQPDRVEGVHGAARAGVSALCPRPVARGRERECSARGADQHHGREAGE